MLHGSMKEHYSKLGSYVAALKQGNPTSVFTLYTNPNITSNPTVFQRLFVCFDAFKQGWLLSCRKLLCADSCFLKTFLGGHLMAVIGRDGNEKMFPVAWAVVEGENNESYEWFFPAIEKQLGRSRWRRSIVTRIAKEFPKAEHKHCARHIFANWHKTYKGVEMKLLFWNCAKAYNEVVFNDALDAIREVDHKAAEAFIASLLEVEKDKVAQCRVAVSTPTVFQVAHGINVLTVDLEARTCTCRKWDLTGIPCFHDVAAIFYIFALVEDYVNKMYKREAYLGRPGRPRKKRRRAPHENPKKPGKLTKHGIEMSCSVCKSKSHNKRKCPDKDKEVAPAPKRPMGRPRKSGAAEANEASQIASEVHHTSTTQRTRIGRGGRVIKTGRGVAARGRGRTGVRGGGGRGGRGGRAPQGFRVLIDESGNAYTNLVGSSTGPRSILLRENAQQSVNQ
ncbi:uncharacterized protein LOC141602128 [Silene latifolia]|uniref:uncharacterized protein LOC141602128 n=1 Tax=Silene latifolia TaxID=37657 RepID=UPI003D77F9FE